MRKIVLDASSILALLNQETGFEEVDKVMENAVTSAVNFSEVVAKLAESGVPREIVLQIMENLNLEIIAFDDAQAITAGMLRPLTKSLGLSFGDRACIALGIYLGLPVLTADSSWSNLKVETKILMIR